MARDVVLDALVQTAVTVTDASAGWVLARDDKGHELHVAAIATRDDFDAAALRGAAVPANVGTAGYVVATGQPLALSVAASDPRAGEGVAELLGRRPVSVLCVACEHGDLVLGAIELVDKTGGGAFSFDDVEMLTLLAGLGGAALSSTGQEGTEPPSPRELHHDLERLLEREPARYAAVAAAIAALIARA